MTDTKSYDELIKLKELLDMGIITEDEFSAKKKQVLGLGDSSTSNESQNDCNTDFSKKTEREVNKCDGVTEGENVEKTEEVPKKESENTNQEGITHSKIKRIGIVAVVVLAIIIVVSIVIVSNKTKKVDNTGTSEGLANIDSETDELNDESATKHNDVADVYSDLEIVAKKENGTTVKKFKQLGDKLFISSDYEKCEFQCPYELILKEKNLDLYDRVCLIEHRVDEVIEDKDEDGNYVEIIDGVNHYFLDTIRVMCEYSSSDDLFTVKKYYNICMTNWLHENWNEWSSITTEYVFNDEELNYSNFNDTYWYIEGDDILNIGMENLIDWENGEEYLNYADLKAYMHFYDLANVPIESIWEDGTFRTPYEEHYEIGTVKLLYNGRSIEKKLYAGGYNGDGFLQAELSADEGLRVNIGIHAVDEEFYNNNRTTAKYVEIIDGNKYVGGTYPMAQISKSEYDINSADVDAIDDTEEGISEYSNDDICNMCSKHFLSVYGEEPPYAIVDHEEGDKVTVQLCEVVDEDGYGYNSWAFYAIDRNTLNGYNEISGEEIDLTPFAQ